LQTSALTQSLTSDHRMIILGVDPGSRLMGFGCIEKNGNQLRVLEHGTIRLFHKEYEKIPVDETTPSRLKEIFEKLSEVVKKHKPQALAVEKVFFAKNAISALKLGQARGVVLLVGAIYDLEIYEYSVTEIKSMVTGHGRSDKDQVAKMLQMILGAQQFETADASDALALAVGHAMANRNGLRDTVSKASKKKSSSLKSLAEGRMSKLQALKR
jgi:crossover junction endodeoxyribonuclease RuvC